MLELVGERLLIPIAAGAARLDLQP